MSTNRKITDAANNIMTCLRDLDSPKDAISAMLIAHVALTRHHAEDEIKIDELVERYGAAFKRLFEEAELRALD